MPPTDDNQNTMRDDFEAAIAEVEEVEQENQPEVAEALPDDQPEDIAADDGEEAPQTETKAKDETQDSPEPEPGKQLDAESDDTSDSGEESQPRADRRPPESWPPAVREEWTGLPASVRAQITKRETEINRALNDGAQNRKAGEKFNTLAEQYASVIAAEGAPDAMSGVEGLFKTVAELRMGSPQQRATKVAQLIQHYGVDINMLDDVLAQAMGGEVPEGVDDSVASLIDQRMAPVNDVLERLNNQERQRIYQANQDAIAEVAAFRDSHEFYTDVQNDMADLVELAEKRGYKMPLQEAYDKACAANPEIAEILRKREEQERLVGNQQELDNKRAAASSITGDRSGAPATGIEDLSLRDQLATLYDAQIG